MPPAPLQLTAVKRPTASTTPVALVVPAQAGEVAGVRRAVEALGLGAGLDADRLADVALAVGEACANAVVHAYAGRKPGVLRVTAEVTAQGLEVTVADDGHGMAPRGDSPGLGLGLPLMTALTTAIELRVAAGGGTEIWMIFAIRGAAATAAWARTG